MGRVVQGLRSRNLALGLSKAIVACRSTLRLKIYVCLRYALLFGTCALCSPCFAGTMPCAELLNLILPSSNPKRFAFRPEHSTAKISTVLFPTSNSQKRGVGTGITGQSLERVLKLRPRLT